MNHFPKRDHAYHLVLNSSEIQGQNLKDLTLLIREHLVDRQIFRRRMQAPVEPLALHSEAEQILACERQAGHVAEVAHRKLVGIDSRSTHLLGRPRPQENAGTRTAGVVGVAQAEVQLQLVLLHA